MRTRIAALPLLMLVAACTSARVSTTPSGEFLDRDGPIDGFASFDGIRPYDGNIVTLGIFGSERPGEWLSLGIWPLFDIGIGPIGARAQILPLEFGGGVGWYTPVSRREAEEAAHQAHGSRPSSTSTYTH